MNEYLIGFIGTLKLLPPIVFGLFYWLGGRRFKWLRRYVAPVVLIGLCFAITRNWKFLLVLPTISGALHLGYGDDDLIGKIAKRFLYGLALGGACMPLAIFGHIWLGVIQIIIAIVGSVLLGVINPVKAPEEENLIGVLSVILIPFMG